MIDLRALQAEMDIGPLIHQLDSELVGLAPVKRRIREIASFLLVARARERAGFNSSPPTLHMAFTGNPGTGKTTVARLLSQIYRSLGVVKKGHLVETDRSQLVAGYVGQTAIQVR
jgi:SpoVK/Ycf46/Vps4 family AAA+-type ATPase